MTFIHCILFDLVLHAGPMVNLGYFTATLNI